LSAGDIEKAGLWEHLATEAPTLPCRSGLLDAGFRRRAAPGEEAGFSLMPARIVNFIAAEGLEYLVACAKLVLLRVASLERH
jgi:hypothetical protein